MGNLTPKAFPRRPRHRMRQWLKKHKKPRQPSQQPAGLGIPSHTGPVPLGTNVELVPGVGPEGTISRISKPMRG